MYAQRIKKLYIAGYLRNIKLNKNTSRGQSLYFTLPFIFYSSQRYMDNVIEKKNQKQNTVCCKFQRKRVKKLVTSIK